MAIFQINQSVFNEGWDSNTIALAVYLFGRGYEDGWGLIHEKQAVFAEVLRQSADEVAASLNVLVSQNVLFRYDVNGQTYLATRRYQDHQKRKYFPARGPQCPIPPLGIFRKLSRKTREIFGKCPDRLPAPVAVAVAVAVDVAVKSAGDGSCPLCAWAKLHAGEGVPEGPRFRNQRFHDLACSVLGIACFRLGGKEQSLLARAARFHGEDTLFEWWEAFLREPCSIGHSVAAFNSRLQRYSELEARRREDPNDTRPG